MKKDLSALCCAIHHQCFITHLNMRLCARGLQKLEDVRECNDVIRYQLIQLGHLVNDFIRERG